MRVVIVGCGYVGFSLATELARQGCEVFGVRRTADATAQLEAAGVQPVLADVADPASLRGLPGPFDWVVNCVSSAGGGAADYRRIYLDGTRNLLAWLAERPPRKFVYTSSTGVYGQTDGSLVTETSPTDPPTETGRILLETERLLLDAARQRAFPAVILRVAGIYGPGRGHYLQQLLNNEARIEGTGERYLNMIHRDDVVGVMLAALRNGQSGEIYNAVDDEPVTQVALFRWLAEALGRLPLPATPVNAAAARKRGLTSKRVSNAKLKSELGYRFQYPTFREGFFTEMQRLIETNESRNPAGA